MEDRVHTDALGERNIRDREECGQAMTFEEAIQEKAKQLRQETTSTAPYNQVEDLQRQMKRMEEHYSAELRKARVELQEVERELLLIYRMYMRRTGQV